MRVLWDRLSYATVVLMVIFWITAEMEVNISERDNSFYIVMGAIYVFCKIEYFSCKK